METEIKTEKEENLIKEIRDKLKLKKVLKKVYEDQNIKVRKKREMK